MKPSLDQQWIGQYAEPGVIGDFVRENEQVAAVLGDESNSSEGLEDVSFSFTNPKPCLYNCAPPHQTPEMRPSMPFF